MSAAIASAGRRSDAPSTDRADMQRRFAAVRAVTEDLAGHLAPEDQVVQSMTDASPTKWHRAHVTWFFETFLLGPYGRGYRPFHPDYAFLFNSYYVQAGPRHARPERGMLTRPSCAEIAQYRAHVDAAMAELIETADEPTWAAVAPLVELGLNHEQQHQELLLTDILHAFSLHPFPPAFAAYKPGPARAATALEWIDFECGIRQAGHDGDGFAYDNEGPRHDVLIHPFRLASRAVTNGEWRDFVADGGYARPELWLSDGFATVEAEGWQAPIYWRADDDGWLDLTLAGLQPLDTEAPVAQISYYEADAFARWTGKRLPTEFEWEVAAADLPVAGNTLGARWLRPLPAPEDTAGGLAQMFGDVWEWTGSAYLPYPGFRPPAGAVGEYNGKFMCNQFVLRGGSCATPDGHVRATYRNFFYPHQRWQFAGLRLAEDG